MKRGTILIVEDDKSIRETLALTLEMEGYAVLTAEHGHEGIIALRSMKPPCLVLLDLEMPVMDGLEFLRVKASDVGLSKAPVVVVSAVPERAKDCGAIEYIKKPVEIEKLLRVVEKYCGSSS